MPGVDTFWARRTHGPGMSSLYHFQVGPEVAFVTLRAALEMEELNLFQKSQRARIDKPLNDYNKFFLEVARPFAIDASALPLTLELTEQKKENHEVLREAVSARRDSLNAALDCGDVNRLLIKLSQESLQSTLDLSLQTVTSFYYERLTGCMDGTVGEYWGSKGLYEEDFDGLMRHFYGHAFGGEFLVPLQSTDKTFVIKVTQPSYRDFLTHFPYAIDEELAGAAETF